MRNICLACAVVSSALSISASAQPCEDDPVRTSIAFIGCNRIGYSAPKEDTSPSTANVAQLQATFEDIAAMETPPKFLFFCGDLVRNGATSGGKLLHTELTAWQQLFIASPIFNSATTLVPIPGNHELLKSTQAPNGHYYENPSVDTYPVWNAWCKQNGHNRFAGNGPQAGGVDHLSIDESELTYSFDSPESGPGRIHFVIIDTDAMSTVVPDDVSCYQVPSFDGNDKHTVPLPGWIAAHWIRADIEAAQANPDIDLIFALGHKPITDPFEEGVTGRVGILNCGEYPLADHLLETFATNDKFRGYLTSHVHSWNANLLAPHDDCCPPVWQIIAGNGGSSLEWGWEPKTPSGLDDTLHFGYSVVTIHESGRVYTQSHGRPVPDPYYAAELTDDERTTTLRNEIFLGPPCAGDMNNSGRVDCVDLQWVFNTWKNNSSSLIDLFCVLAHLGNEC